MRLYIVSIGYQKIAIREARTAIEIVENGILVNAKYIDGKTIYTPAEEHLGIEVVDSSLIRPITKEEDVSIKVKEAENQRDWARDERDNLKKEVEKLKCKIQLLTSEDKDA